LATIKQENSTYLVQIIEALDAHALDSQVNNQFSQIRSRVCRVVDDLEFLDRTAWKDIVIRDQIVRHSDQTVDHSMLESPYKQVVAKTVAATELLPLLMSLLDHFCFIFFRASDCDEFG